MIQVTLPGTGGTQPLPDRALACMAVHTNGASLLIDCGEGTQTRLRQCGISLYKLDAVLLTHYHGDHIFGLPGLLQTMGSQNRTAPLILCGEERVEGQHAASVGRLDDAKLYYLRSRGLSAAQARRLMVDARFAPAIEKLPDEALRQEVRHFVAERLDAYEPLDR